MKLKESLKSGKFVVTAELSPPKGVNTKSFLDKANMIKGMVDAVNVTDQQGSVMRLGSLAGCCLLRQLGVEPVFQLTCRDRNRMALQSDLLSAHVLNINNVLCLTGDHVKNGDHSDAVAVYDLDATSLIGAANTLNNGRDMAGCLLDGVPDFFIGAGMVPEADIPELELIRVERKIEAGADFFQTQCIFDVGRAGGLIKEAAKSGKPILAGILLLRSASMAGFLNSRVPGVFVPDSLIKEISLAGNSLNKGIEIAARTIAQVKDICSGVHIMTLGCEEWIPSILEKAGIER